MTQGSAQIQRSVRCKIEIPTGRSIAAPCSVSQYLRKIFGAPSSVRHSFFSLLLGTLGRFALLHPIDHTLASPCDQFVPFLQKFGENRKVPYWVLCGLRVGLNIDNVDRRMPGKISLQVSPGAGQDSATRIETWDWSAEHFTCEWKGGDVATGRASLGI